MTTKNRDDVFPAVVVGAGLAGLTAAVHLAERDIPPLVLEADTEWAGGRLAGGESDSFEYQGKIWSFPSQHGIHALWGGYDNMREVLNRFLDVKLQTSDGEEWINRWGGEVRAVEAGTTVRNSWIPAPFHYIQLLLRFRFWNTITPLDFLSLPGMLVSLFLATGIDPIPEEVTLDGLMMDEFFRGWTPNLKATFTGLAHSLLAAPSEKISLTGFIAAMRFYTISRRDVWQLDYLPTNSNDCLIQPFIDAIQERGGEVHKGRRLKSLRREGDIWNLQVEDAKLGGTRSLYAENVILAVHPTGAEEILTESQETKQIAQTLRFPDCIRNATIRLWFDALPREGAAGGMFTGDFLMDNFFWLHRINAGFAAWHQETGGSAIEVHLYAPESVLDQPSEMLIIQVTNEVFRAFPELRGHFVHGALRQNSATQTQFIVPDKNSLHVKTPWQGIYACGDWIGHPNPALWMERCCITGIAAANEVLQKYDAETFTLIPPRKPELPVRFLGGVVKLGRRILTPVILGLARTWRKLS